MRSGYTANGLRFRFVAAIAAGSRFRIDLDKYTRPPIGRLTVIWPDGREWVVIENVVRTAGEFNEAVGQFREAIIALADALGLEPPAFESDYV